MDHTEAIAAARRSLERTATEGRWALSDGYWPLRRDPDRPASSGPPGDPLGADEVAGDRYAIGLGNDRARSAFRLALVELAGADYRLALALVLVGVGCQPGTVATPKAETAVELDRLVGSLRWRLTTLDRLELDRCAERTARTALLGRPGASSTSIVARIFRAEDAVCGAMGRADETVGRVLTMCRICRFRPVARKKGPRCDACAQHRYRHGDDRPARRDAVVERTELLATHARHRAAGRGYGWE